MMNDDLSININMSLRDGSSPEEIAQRIKSMLKPTYIIKGKFMRGWRVDIYKDGVYQRSIPYKFKRHARRAVEYAGYMNRIRFREANLRVRNF